MFMSSPFRSSHRRSRSHSSLSSPSSSPVARSDKHRAPITRPPTFISTQACSASSAVAGIGRSIDSPFSAQPVFTAQPPVKWDVEAWRRGKRARREPQSPSEDADMESYDEPMPSSPIVEDPSSTNSWSMSAPSTPHPQLATTSDAFQFFPSKASSAANQVSTLPFATHTPFTGSSSHPTDELEQMRSDAFSDLRKTVSEAGEGFVRRMREFEAHRRTGSARVSTALSHSEASERKPSYHKRGRKRPSPMSHRQITTTQSNVGVIDTRGKGDENDGEEESDVEIRSSYASGSDDFRDWSPSKKRAVSLSALSYQDAGPLSQSHTLPFPIPLRSRDRSSSSASTSAYSNSSSSEDDDDDEIPNVAYNAADRPLRRRAPRFRPNARSSAKYSSPPSLSFSFSTSNNSSRMSLGAGAPSPISPFGAPHSLSSSPNQPSVLGGTGNMTTASGCPPLLEQPSKASEKAVEALSLALANGAGSVSDYDALRKAQNVLIMENSEAGSLWD